MREPGGENGPGKLCQRHEPEERASRETRLAVIVINVPIPIATAKGTN